MEHLIAVSLWIDSEQADASQIDAATRSLRSELLVVDDCEVSQPTTPTPPGAKVVETAMLGQLLLTFIGSGGICVTLISVIRDWLISHKDYKLRVKHGDSEIELCGDNPEKLKELLADVKSLMMTDFYA